VFLDVVSYGRSAIQFCLATVGAGPLVFGSDHPVIKVEPTLRVIRSLGGKATAIHEENPTRLFR
jgi:predicted TIM-barrel fold metal-dependent hydrolase